MSNYKVITGSTVDMPELVFQAIKSENKKDWYKEVIINKIVFNAIKVKLHEDGWLFFNGIDDMLNIKGIDVRVIDKSFLPICVITDGTLSDDDLDKIIRKVNGLC